MIISRASRIAIIILTAVLVAGGIGIASAKTSESSCKDALLASISPLSSEHPRIQPSVRTKIIAPFVVRASTKVPLVAGHETYHSRTYIALFGWVRERGATDVYLL